MNLYWNSVRNAMLVNRLIISCLYFLKFLMFFTSNMLYLLWANRLSLYYEYYSVLSMSNLLLHRASWMPRWRHRFTLVALTAELFCTLFLLWVDVLGFSIFWNELLTEKYRIINWSFSTFWGKSGIRRYIEIVDSITYNLRNRYDEKRN